MPTRILIADDNPLFRTALRQVLEASDSWEIIETRDGQEAVTTAVETRPDVIILDLAMPVKDGLAAAREISRLLPETPILMCTLHDSPAVELEARKSGIRQLISKSESIEVITAIRQVLATTPPPGSTPIGVLPEIASASAETITLLPAPVENGASPVDSIGPPAINPAPDKAAS